MTYKPGSLYLGLPGQEIELPAPGRTVIPSEEEIEKKVVAIDGTICSDLVGVRPIWNIQYEIQTGPDIETLLSLYRLHEDLNFIEVGRDGTVNEYTVIMSPVARTRYRTAAEWLWKGISFRLEAVECYL